MQVAFDLEDAGEVINPFPPGLVRHEGRVFRPEPGGDAKPEAPLIEDDGFDVSQSFIGQVRRVLCVIVSATRPSSRETGPARFQFQRIPGWDLTRPGCGRPGED